MTCLSGSRYAAFFATILFAIILSTGVTRAFSAGQFTLMRDGPPVVNTVWTGILSISPSVGSTEGGTVVTITGYGFAYPGNSNKIFFGDSSVCSADLYLSTSARIVCTTGASPEKTVSVKLVISAGDSAECLIDAGCYYSFERGMHVESVLIKAFMAITFQQHILQRSMPFWEGGFTVKRNKR